MIGPASSLLRLVSVATATVANSLVRRNDVLGPAAVLARSLHLTSNLEAKNERRDLRTKRHGAARRDEGAVGEQNVEIDKLGEQEDIFPDVNTPDRLFDGIPFKELPCFNIKCCPNNTIMTLTDFKGKVHILRSCGIEGFKTAKKGTNIAAQTTAITMSTKALGIGVSTARVRVQGLGPGRLAAIKGLQMGGINIVSITDNTHVSWSGPRPRKQRRV